MPFNVKGSGGKSQVQEMKPKEKPGIVEEGLLKPNEVRVVLRYIRQGKEVSESIVVPRSLIVAMADPGESNMKPLEAMRELDKFYINHIKSELKELLINGGVSIPVSVMSANIQYSYAAHAFVAATTKTVSDSLMLEDAEVDKKLRTVAALLCGVSQEQIQKLDLDETTVFVGRTTTKIERKPEIKMKVERLTCDYGSHREVKDFTIPNDTTVSEAKEIAEQRLKRMPDVKRALDEAYEKIEELRGKPLTKEERNAVVAYMNITYIQDPKNRLIVTP